jgi:hypothetical protein
MHRRAGFTLRERPYSPTTPQSDQSTDVPIYLTL